MQLSSFIWRALVFQGGRINKIKGLFVWHPLIEVFVGFSSLIRWTELIALYPIKFTVLLHLLYILRPRTIYDIDIYLYNCNESWPKIHWILNKLSHLDNLSLNALFEHMDIIKWGPPQGTFLYQPQLLTKNSFHCGGSGLFMYFKVGQGFQRLDPQRLADQHVSLRVKGRSW